MYEVRSGRGPFRQTSSHLGFGTGRTTCGSGATSRPAADPSFCPAGGWAWRKLSSLVDKPEKPFPTRRVPRLVWALRIARVGLGRSGRTQGVLQQLASLLACLHSPRTLIGRNRQGRFDRRGGGLADRATTATTRAGHQATKHAHRRGRHCRALAPLIGPVLFDLKAPVARRCGEAVTVTRNSRRTGARTSAANLMKK